MRALDSVIGVLGVFCRCCTPAVAIIGACSFSSCAGFNIRIGVEYQQPNGSSLGASVEIDPSFVKQKK